MKPLLFVFLTLIFITACQHPAVFKEYKGFDNVSWNRYDFLNFEVDVEKDQRLDFDLAIRHHTYYPYDYLDVNITFFLQDGDIRSRDYHFELKDADGNWKSKGMGELWDIELSIRKEMSFYEDGICKVRIENKMTKMETPGLIEIGLIVYESE